MNEIGDHTGVAIITKGGFVVGDPPSCVSLATSESLALISKDA